MSRKKIEAIAYLRTSSAANVKGDSDKRQRAAIAAFAKAKGYHLAGEFYDAAVSGADPIETRPGFSALLDRIEGNGVRVVLVEDASRFARDLVAQELGLLMLGRRGVRVLTAGGDDLTDTSDPTRIMMRQIAGAFAQYEKARLVAKLKAARDRKAAAGGKAYGRYGYVREAPRAVALAQELRGEGKSLRAIASAMAERGLVTSGGRPYSANAVAKMLDIRPSLGLEKAS
jgi:DNA invertase Pin-like site-specific DNA recombinase